MKHLAPHLVLCGFLAFAPLSCTTGGTMPPVVQDHKALVKVAVVIGVGQFLKERPTLAPLVWRFAHDGAATLQGALDLTQLEATIMKAVDQVKVSADQKLMLHLLVNVILSEVQNYITRAQLEPTQIQMFVGEVFSWIEQTAMVKLGGKVPLN